MMREAFRPVIPAGVVLWAPGESVREWLTEGLDSHLLKRWYGVAVGLPLGLGEGLTISSSHVTRDRLPQTAAIYPLLRLIASFLGGRQEAVGWPGFALPTSVLIGLDSAVRHLPAFAFEIPGSTSSFALYALLVVEISMVITWLYNSTDGRILLAMLFHGRSMWLHVLAEYSLGISQQLTDHRS